MLLAAERLRNHAPCVHIVGTRWGHRSRHMAAYLFGKKEELRYCSRHETSLSAEKAQAGACARVFRENAQHAWAENAHAPPPQGPHAPFGISDAKERPFDARRFFGRKRAEALARRTLLTLGLPSLCGSEFFICVCRLKKNCIESSTEKSPKAPLPRGSPCADAQTSGCSSTRTRISCEERGGERSVCRCRPRRSCTHR